MNFRAGENLGSFASCLSQNGICIATYFLGSPLFEPYWDLVLPDRRREHRQPLQGTVGPQGPTV